MINIREVESKLTDELKATFIGKEYSGEVFPFELAQGSSQFIATIVGNYIQGLTSFNIKPIKHGNMLMVSVTDEEESTIVDIMFTVEFPVKDKEDHIIVKSVLCSLKDYIFERTAQV
jgi:hypothetical protein